MGQMRHACLTLCGIVIRHCNSSPDQSLMKTPYEQVLTNASGCPEAYRLAGGAVSTCTHCRVDGTDHNNGGFAQAQLLSHDLNTVYLWIFNLPMCPGSLKFPRRTPRHVSPLSKSGLCSLAMAKVETCCSRPKGRADITRNTCRTKALRFSFWRGAFISTSSPFVPRHFVCREFGMQSRYAVTSQSEV